MTEKVRPPQSSHEIAQRSAALTKVGDYLSPGDRLDARIRMVEDYAEALHSEVEQFLEDNPLPANTSEAAKEQTEPSSAQTPSKRKR